MSDRSKIIVIGDRHGGGGAENGKLENADGKKKCWVGKSGTEKKGTKLQRHHSP